MARLNIAPTKSNQLNLTRDLAMATEGFALLEQKREILVMELMRLLNQVKQVQGGWKYGVEFHATPRVAEWLCTSAQYRQRHPLRTLYENRPEITALL